MEGRVLFCYLQIVIFPFSWAFMFLTSEIPSTASLKVDINDFQFFKITSIRMWQKWDTFNILLFFHSLVIESRLTNNVVETVGRTF